MRSLGIYAFAVTTIGLLSAIVYVSAQQPVPPGDHPAVPPVATPPPDIKRLPGFAIVELFTSEGCSSCPPADQNLERISEHWKDANVIPLSFHVDYWNRLGWRDPFSHPASTRRQQDYAAIFQSREVFTPQMIINGKVSLNGSDRARADQVIQKALEVEPQFELQIHPIEQGPDSPRVQYRLLPVPAGGQRLTLNIALTSPLETVQVDKGENSGRQLRHVAVVKHFHSVPLAPGGGSVGLPNPVEPVQKWNVVAFVQSPDTGAVTAATSLAWSPVKAP